MASCSEFKIKIPKDTPDYKLYEELRDDYGITDAQIDAHGYHVVNYAEPGKQPALLGAGDCEIAVKEVREFALDDWKKYRAPLERLIGSRVPWALDDINSPFPKNEAQKKWEVNFFKQADTFIKLIETKLSKKGPSGNDDNYIEGKSVALYWFKMTPEKEFLDLWPQVQKKKLKKEIEKSLKPYGLGAVAKYLIKNGGIRSLVPYINYTPTSVNVYPPNFFNVDLYGLFEYAGLSPQFVETVGYTDDNAPYKCGAPLVPHFVVGQMVGGELRLFDSFLGDPDFKKMYSYPVHMEHAIGLWISSNQLLDIVAGDDSQTLQISNGASFGSFALHFFLNEAKQLHAGADEKNTVDEMLGFKKKFSSNPYILLAADGFLTNLNGSNMSEELFQNPLPSIRGEAYRFAALTSLGEHDDKKAMEYAKKLLELDNKCSAGYEVMSLVDYSLGNLDDAKVNLEKAEGLAGPRNHTKSFYATPGKIYLDQGHLDESIAMLEKHLKFKAKKNESYAMAQFLLGVAYERSQDEKKAEKIVLEIVETIETYISDASLKKAEKLVEALDKHIKQYEPKISSLCNVFATLGQIYLHHSKFEEAEKLLGKAKGFNASSPHLFLLKKQLEMMKGQKAGKK